MKKTQKNIDQLKKISTSLINKDQQKKVKGGQKRSKIKIPANG